MPLRKKREKKWKIGEMRLFAIQKIPPSLLCPNWFDQWNINFYSTAKGNFQSVHLKHFRPEPFHAICMQGSEGRWGNCWESLWEISSSVHRTSQPFSHSITKYVMDVSCGKNGILRISSTSILRDFWDCFKFNFELAINLTNQKGIDRASGALCPNPEVPCLSKRRFLV